MSKKICKKKQTLKDSWIEADLDGQLNKQIMFNYRKQEFFHKKKQVKKPEENENNYILMGNDWWKLIARKLFVRLHKTHFMCSWIKTKVRKENEFEARLREVFSASHNSVEVLLRRCFNDSSKNQNSWNHNFINNLHKMLWWFLKGKICRSWPASLSPFQCSLFSVNEMKIGFLCGELISADFRQSK